MTADYLTHNPSFCRSLFQKFPPSSPSSRTKRQHLSSYIVFTMILVQILLIAMGALLTDADECSCECYRSNVCEELANFTRWNRYFEFVRRMEKDWQSQVAHVVWQQTRVEVNKTMEGVKETFLTLSKQMEDLIIRVGSLENSLRTLQERANELDLTMELTSNQMTALRAELLQNQSAGTHVELGGGHSSDQCGVDLENGGNNGGGNMSSVLVWPWMAAVYGNYNSGPVYICGGTVIHRHFVLTSANCAYVYRSAGLFVKLGLSDLKKETHLQEIRVRSTHIHPQFKHGSHFNYDYDVALLELEEAIQFSPFVRPVCLPPQGLTEDEAFYKTQSSAKAVDLSSYLRSPGTKSPTLFNLTILSTEDCRRIVKELGWEADFPSPGMSFCVESSTGCPSTGSPLIQSRVEEGARTWTQVGMQSLCTDKYITSPRLHLFTSWVDRTIADSSKQ